MPSLPIQLQRVGVPPIKCQGIKTKLVPFILSQIRWQEKTSACWVEPFLGSGVVAFNLAPRHAILTDSNQHIIRFYQAIQQGDMNRAIAQAFLQREGAKLNQFGADYYYEVRQRFNQTGDPLDFLFLNRACFNGLMRFNGNAQFNVPFCQKPGRFSQSYVTKIVNQIDWVARQMTGKNWKFCVAHWQTTLQTVCAHDFVYLDPPYIGRHTDYYNAWSQAEAQQLALTTQQLPCGVALSMWLENQHRHNSHIQECWSEMEIRSQPHFYHVGSKENWRGAITEALLIKPGYATVLNKRW